MTVAIDMPMPETCGKCMFRQTYWVDVLSDGSRCMLTSGDIKHVVERPWWCPLKEVRDD